MQIIAENQSVSPSNFGKFPYKYCPKSQFKLTKNLIKSTLKFTTKLFITSADIYPSNGIAIATALFVNNVLKLNASIANNITFGNCVIVCSRKSANSFIAS